jgi:ATP-binding cassette subfamily B (MDR/TAP) protein 1
LNGDDFSAQANQTAQEGIAAIRTVHSYSMEAQVSGIYRDLLRGPFAASKKASQISGLSFAMSQFIQFAVYSLAFWCAFPAI